MNKQTTLRHCKRLHIEARQGKSIEGKESQEKAKELEIQPLILLGVLTKKKKTHQANNSHSKHIEDLKKTLEAPCLMLQQRTHFFFKKDETKHTSI